MEYLLENITLLLDMLLRESAVILCGVCGLVLYFALLCFVIPKSLKVTYECERYLGRGVKRFAFPGGRGVLYEPHPVFRKYLPLYTLFSREGYKLLRLKVDETVRALSYKVVMFGSNDKVLDVLSVKDVLMEKGTPHQMLLHEETAYVALWLESVNGAEIKQRPHRFFRLANLLLYAGLCAVCTFLTFLLLRWVGRSVLGGVSDLLKRQILSGNTETELLTLFAKMETWKAATFGTPASYLLPALCITAVAVGIVLLYAKKQGIGVKLYERK